jgi:hypothetical protein
MTTVFNPSRVVVLMRHDLQPQLKSLLNGLLAAAGIAFGLMILASIGPASSAAFHASTFSNLLFIGGYVVSSMAFSELQDEKRGLHYLMLPGSAVEKYVARLLLTSVGWVAAALITYVAATALGAAVAQPLFGRSPGVFLPTTGATWETIGYYLITQSAFVFGSVYFRKAAFIKTVAAAVAVALSIALIGLVVGRIAFADLFVGVLQTRSNVAELVVTGPRFDGVIRAFDTVRLALLYVSAPFFWVVGVMRLRETEA